MPATRARDIEIRVSTTSGGTYDVVDDLNDASMSHSGDNIDVTVFGDDYVARIQGLKDGSYSLSGFLNASDANGQMRIRDAFLNDTALFVQFLHTPGAAAGSQGFQQEVKVASFDISLAPDGAKELSIDLEGAGDIETV